MTTTPAAPSTPGLAIVRVPSPRLAEGIVTHQERVPVDAGLALHQWHAYIAALEESGWSVLHAPRADDCPDGVFVEDAVVVLGDVAVLTRPGAPARRPEVAGVGDLVRSLGYRVVEVTEPATIDGGDVLKVGTTVYVGVGGRTTSAGAQQLAAAFAPLGAQVVEVPVSVRLHLKSEVTALPDGTVIGFPPAVDDPSVYPSFLAVPEEPGAHVVLLGGDRVLMAASAPRTAELLAARGLEPVVVDISEYEKLEGCVTCLSVRLREVPDVPPPPQP